MMWPISASIVVSIFSYSRVINLSEKRGFNVMVNHYSFRLPQRNCIVVYSNRISVWTLNNSVNYNLNIDTSTILFFLLKLY